MPHPPTETERLAWLVAFGVVIPSVFCAGFELSPRLGRTAFLEFLLIAALSFLIAWEGPPCSAPRSSPP